MKLSMGDIATLGRVKRPVVTVWRRRYADGPAPFPLPVSRDPLRFEADEVVSWLSETGRGNSPDPGPELAGISLRESAPKSWTGAAQLSAMLTLRHLYGHALVDDLAHADEVLGVVGALDSSAAVLEDLPEANELRPMAQAVEAFVDHHLGVADAHRWMAQRWFASAWPELANHELDPALAQLIARAAVAIAEAIGSPGLLDASGNGHSWLPLVPADWEGDCRVVGAGPLARHALRCALLAERDATSVQGPDEAAVAVDLVFSESSADVQDQLTPKGHAVRLVVGPARELCDPLPEAVGREAALRDGVVRAIFKLPSGLRATSPREHLAIWLLAERDEQPFEEQRTFVADLSGMKLDSMQDDLVGDISAAVLDPLAHGRRNWRVLQPVRTSHLLARPGSLVAAPSRRAGRVGAPEDAVVSLERLANLSGLGGVARFSAHTEPVRKVVSVTEAMRRGWLRALPGVRLGGSGLPNGNMPVWCGSQTGVAVERRVDRFAALAVPRAWLTEPGDIILRGAGLAVVDSDGGALVQYPARAMRVVAGAPVLPEQIVRAIVAGAPGSTSDQWEFGVADQSRRAGLSAISGRIRQRRAELLAELQHLQDFEDQLFEACENQLVDLEVD